MSRFFRLRSPSRRAGSEVTYGRAEWEAYFGSADWSPTVHTKTETITCPVHRGHARPAGRVGDLAVVLPSTRIGDFVWTWHHECLVTERVLGLFDQFSGYRACPVRVDKVKRLGKGSEDSPPKLWEIRVTGSGGDADPSSGIRVIYECRHCGLIRYSSYENGILVDESRWDGSDFFVVNGYSSLLLVTERVAKVVENNRLTNCMLIPSELMRWPEGVVKPEEVYE